MKRIHLDMSDTLDQTDPAGAMLSVFPSRVIRDRISPQRMRCSDVRLAQMPATSGSVSVIPNGAKMRVRRKDSHDMPEARSTIMPATPYITFW